MLIDARDLVLHPKRSVEEQLAASSLGMLRALNADKGVVTFLLIDTFDNGLTCWGWWVEKKRFVVVEPGMGPSDTWKTYRQGENPYDR